ncbi:hypothetical protein HMPREF1982_03823 [Clostridiales bacterium oral taxon 876 str. F0540]|nr:hypothetical protein HMPREF1982_03823 [Clostridiales bacterium oral taxon 876 str. F0540]
MFYDNTNNRNIKNAIAIAFGNYIHYNYIALSKPKIIVDF